MYQLGEAAQDSKRVTILTSDSSLTTLKRAAGSLLLNASRSCVNPCILSSLTFDGTPEIKKCIEFEA